MDADQVWKRVTEFANACLAQGTPIFTSANAVRNFITDVKEGSIGRRSDEGTSNASRVTRGEVARLWDELNGGPRVDILFFTRALVAAALPELIETIDGRIQLRSRGSSSRTFILTWNPSRWPWTDLDDELAASLRGEAVEVRWSTGNTKKIEPGDQLFLLKQGTPPRGIMASGVALKPVFEDEHYDEGRRAAGEKSNYTLVRFDRIVEPDAVMRVEVPDGPLSTVHWAMPASGIELPDAAARQLKLQWDEYVPPRGTLNADELAPGAKYVEGAARVVTVNRYERDPAARAACIAHWGSNCVVCDFSFERVYGPMGTGFIHVHHLSPLAAGSGVREVDPIDDLRPVCPNCHSMLHRTEPPLAIDDLKAHITAFR